MPGYVLSQCGASKNEFRMAYASQNEDEIIRILKELLQYHSYPDVCRFLYTVYQEWLEGVLMGAYSITKNTAGLPHRYPELSLKYHELEYNLNQIGEILKMKISPGELVSTASTYLKYCLLSLRGMFPRLRMLAYPSPERKNDILSHLERLEVSLSRAFHSIVGNESEGFPFGRLEIARFLQEELSASNALSSSEDDDEVAKIISGFFFRKRVIFAPEEELVQTRLYVPETPESKPKECPNAPRSKRRRVRSPTDLAEPRILQLTLDIHGQKETSV